MFNARNYIVLAIVLFVCSPSQAIGGAKARRIKKPALIQITARSQGPARTPLYRVRVKRGDNGALRIVAKNRLGKTIKVVTAVAPREVVRLTLVPQAIRQRIERDGGKALTVRTFGDKSAFEVDSPGGFAEYDPFMEIDQPVSKPMIEVVELGFHELLSAEDHKAWPDSNAVAGRPSFMPESETGVVGEAWLGFGGGVISAYRVDTRSGRSLWKTGAFVQAGSVGALPETVEMDGVSYEIETFSEVEIRKAR